MSSQSKVVARKGEGVMVDKIKLWQGRKGRGAMVDILANVNSALSFVLITVISPGFLILSLRICLCTKESLVVCESGDRDDGFQCPCLTYFQNAFPSTFLLRQ